jgi:ABC-type transport system involved in cytochrome bd biosynthesis fused ATPase/permease subunit
MKRTKTRSTQTLNGSYWLSWSHRRLDMLYPYMTNYLFHHFSFLLIACFCFCFVFILDRLFIRIPLWIWYSWDCLIS